MNIVRKKISELHMTEKNVRKHPQKQIDEMIRSYEMFNQYRPLVITQDGEILVGNGFYTAMVQKGEEEIDCFVLPADTTDEQKKKLMLADNKIFSLGADFMQNVDDILSEMNDFDIPGFDEDVLSQIYTQVEEEVKQIETTGVSGIISAEKVAEIKREAEKREETPSSDDASKYEVKQDVVKMQDEHAGEPYITCPHCGVKIYGYN